MSSSNQQHKPEQPEKVVSAPAPVQQGTAATSTAAPVPATSTSRTEFEHYVPPGEEINEAAARRYLKEVYKSTSNNPVTLDMVQMRLRLMKELADEEDRIFDLEREYNEGVSTNCQLGGSLIRGWVDGVVQQKKGIETLPKETRKFYTEAAKHNEHLFSFTSVTSQAYAQQPDLAERLQQRVTSGHPSSSNLQTPSLQWQQPVMTGASAAKAASNSTAAAAIVNPRKLGAKKEQNYEQSYEPPPKRRIKSCNVEGIENRVESRIESRLENPVLFRDSAISISTEPTAAILEEPVATAAAPVSPDNAATAANIAKAAAATKIQVSPPFPVLEPLPIGRRRPSASAAVLDPNATGSPTALRRKSSAAAAAARPKTPSSAPMSQSSDVPKRCQAQSAPMSLPDPTRPKTPPMSTRRSSTPASVASAATTEPAGAVAAAGAAVIITSAAPVVTSAPRSGAALRRRRASDLPVVAAAVPESLAEPNLSPTATVDPMPPESRRVSQPRRK